MNKRNLFLLLFLLSASLLLPALAQDMIVKAVDGNEEAKKVYTIQTITFSDGNMMMNLKSGSSETKSISEIRKLYFNGLFLGTGELENSGVSDDISIYPNPVIHTIYFNGNIKDNSDVSVYSIDGRLKLSTQLQSGTNSINAENLESGLYVLRINNRTIRFIKQ